MNKSVADFLNDHSPLATEKVTWGMRPLQLTAYLTPDIPPLDYITSSRSIVIRHGEVLMVADPDGRHIIPGGRIEPGETLWQTAQREVTEETGWLTQNKFPDGRLFATFHYHHLAPLTPQSPHPHIHFFQTIYLATPTQHVPHLREQNGHELWAKFTSFDQAFQHLTSSILHALLQNAITFAVQ